MIEKRENVSLRFKNFFLSERNREKREPFSLLSEAPFPIQTSRSDALFKVICTSSVGGSQRRREKRRQERTLQSPVEQGDGFFVFCCRRIVDLWCAL
jgi:hypothetical protein